MCEIYYNNHYDFIICIIKIKIVFRHATFKIIMNSSECDKQLN